MQDEELILQLQAHSEAAFETLVRRYTGYVLTVIRQVAVPPLSEEDAEELTADTFVTLWRKADSLRDPSALKAYLAQIARHAARRRCKQHKTEVPLNEEWLIPTGRQPEAQAALREQTAIVAQAVSAMEPIRRACIVRRYYYNESLASIAGALSIPLSTVKSHVYRGRQQVFEALEERGYRYEQNNISAGSV